MLRKTKTHRNGKKKRSNSNKRKSRKVSRKTMKGGSEPHLHVKGRPGHVQKVHEEGVPRVHQRFPGSVAAAAPHKSLYPSLDPKGEPHVHGVVQKVPGSISVQKKSVPPPSLYNGLLPGNEGVSPEHGHRIASHAELQKALANSLKEHQESIAKKFDPTNPFASEYVAQQKVNPSYNPFAPGNSAPPKVNPLSPQEIEEIKKNYEASLSPVEAQQKAKQKAAQKEYTRLMDDFLVLTREINNSNYTPEQKKTFLNDLQSNFFAGQSELFSRAYPKSNPSSASAKLGNKPLSQKESNNLEKALAESLKNQKTQHSHSGATSNEKLRQQLEAAKSASLWSNYNDAERLAQDAEAYQKGIEASLEFKQPEQKNLSYSESDEIKYLRTLGFTEKEIEQQQQELGQFRIYQEEQRKKLAADFEKTKQQQGLYPSLEEQFPGYKPQHISQAAAKYRADLVQKQLTTKALETKANIQRKIWEIKQLKNPSERDTKKLFQLERDLESIIANLPPVGLRLDPYDPQGEALTRAWESEELERNLFAARAAAAQNQKPPSKPSKKNFFFGRNKSSNNFA